jgi:hypothetical protein
MAKKKPPVDPVLVQKSKDGGGYAIPEPPDIVTKSAIDTTVRQQVYLERVSSGMAKEVVGEAQQMAGRVADWLTQQEIELLDLKPEKVQKLIAASKEEQTQLLMSHIEDDLLPKLAELAEYQAGFSARALAAQARKVKIRTVKAIEAYEEALSQPIPATGELLEGFIKTWSKSEVEAVGNLVSKGFAQGWTNAQIVKAIKGTKAAEYKDGVMPNIGKNADAIVRTSVQHVANTTRELTWARNADIIQKERVVATLDGHTTQQCRSLDGQEFPLGKGPKFPIHVRCRTTKVAVLVEEFRALSEGRTRSSETGPIPATETYYDWLKSQGGTEEGRNFQDDAIGPQRAKLLRDGGLTTEEFARLNLGRNFAPMTMDEMRKRAPQAFERAGL